LVPTHRILPAVDCEHDGVFVCQPEIQRIREPREYCASDLATHSRKEQRVVGHADDKRVDLSAKLFAQPCAPAFVPAANVERLPLGLWPENDSTRHSRFNNF